MDKSNGLLIAGPFRAFSLLIFLVKHQNRMEKIAV